MELDDTWPSLEFHSLEQEHVFFISNVVYTEYRFLVSSLANVIVRFGNYPERAGFRIRGLGWYV